TILDSTLTYSDGTPSIGVNTSVIASKSWANSQFLTTETDPTVPSHVKNITTGDISDWNAKAELSDIKDGTLTLATGSGLTGSNTFSANQGTNTTFTVGLSVTTQNSLALADSALQVESDTLDSVVERNGVTDKAITINSIDPNSRFQKVIEPNVSGGYSRIAFDITDKDIVDGSTTTSLYFGVLGTGKQNKKFAYISRGGYNEDKMALKFDVDNAKIYYQSMNTGVNLPVSSTEIATIGDIANSAYTDEQAQDAVGSILSSDFIYNDANPGISIDTTKIATRSWANSQFLTTETDPVFKASHAGGITSGDISNWNSALQSVDWGDIGGTLSNQTDLQNALDIKADESITITGAGDLTGGGDLTANRTLDLTAAAKTKLDHGETAYN